MGAKSARKGKTDDALPEALYSLEHPSLPPEIEARAFRSGGYPYDEPIRSKAYRKQLKRLQIELVKLQNALFDRKERLALVFEGRDSAGKGGTIQRFVQHLNPRHARVCALTKPTEFERGQWYFQRYVAHLPSAGDMTFFDRSWYNRAGVERVMGFCTEAEVERFFAAVPTFERLLVEDGIRLIKLWLTVGREEQLKRFYERRDDPLKRWKLSPVDQAAVGKWAAFSDAIGDLLRRSHTEHAPWTVVKANDQKRARLECMRIVLQSIDYPGKDPQRIGEIDPKLVASGADAVG